MTEHQRWWWRMDQLDRCLSASIDLNEQAHEIWERDYCSPMQLAEREFRLRMKMIAEVPEWIRDIVKDVLHPKETT